MCCVCCVWCGDWWEIKAFATLPNELAHVWPKWSVERIQGGRSPQKSPRNAKNFLLKYQKYVFFLFYIFIILCSEHECRTFYCRNCLHFDWIVFGHVYLGKNVILFNAFHSIFVDLVATFLFHSLSLAKRALSSWRYMQKSSSRENRFCGATKLHQNNIHSVYPWLK